MKHSPVISLVHLVLIVASGGVMASDVLRFNPFEHSDMATGRQQANVRNEMKLRGTVIDGGDSLANIGGNFFRLNQEVSGYRVISIESGRVVLHRGNNETVLTLNDDEQTSK